MECLKYNEHFPITNRTVSLTNKAMAEGDICNAYAHAYGSLTVTAHLIADAARRMAEEQLKPEPDSIRLSCMARMILETIQAEEEK